MPGFGHSCARLFERLPVAFCLPSITLRKFRKRTLPYLRVTCRGWTLSRPQLSQRTEFPRFYSRKRSFPARRYFLVGSAEKAGAWPAVRGGGKSDMVRTWWPVSPAPNHQKRAGLEPAVMVTAKRAFCRIPEARNQYDISLGSSTSVPLRRPIRPGRFSSPWN